MDAEALVGRTFGRYRILSAVRRGGMGEILLAEIASGPGRGRQVVLKRPLDTTDERQRRLFGAEVQLALRLTHPNIVRVFDAPVIDDRPCLAMELIEGSSLGEVLRGCEESGDVMSPRLAVSIAIKVLDALVYAHSLTLDDGAPLELVHCDVSPDNVMISVSGEVKIMDFGVAKTTQTPVEPRTGELRGTLRYMSPEQLQCEPVDKRSDLFSVGLLLFEMLTGRHPFEKGSGAATLRATALGDRPPIDAQLPYDSPELAVVLERALSVGPASRYADAVEMRDALQAVAKALGMPVGSDERASFLYGRSREGKPPAPDPFAITADPLESLSLAEPFDNDITDASTTIQLPPNHALNFIKGIVVGVVAVLIILSVAKVLNG